MMRCLTILSSACLVCSVLSLNLNAAFVVPEFRGLAETTYQEWNVFTSANGLNLPDVANVNPNGTASVQELTGGAFLTSGGNIYSFAVATSFDVLVPDYGLGTQATTRVVLQLRTQGSTVDLASVTFNGQPFDSAELLYEEPLGGFGGTLRDWKFEWSAVSGNVGMNTIQFDAEGSSMSLDRVAVDTQALPAASPAFRAARILHAGFTGSGQPIFDGLDHEKTFAEPSTQEVALALNNIVSSSQGINGIAIDIQGLSDISQLQWAFSVSPQGVFDLLQSPIGDWQSAPQAHSITLYAAQGDDGSDRVVVVWPNFAIVDRYLRVRVMIGQNLLAELYVGHLTGKTIDNAGDTLTVSFADISPIRAAIGTAVDASSPWDINKDGLVTFGDISAMRSHVGTQLTRLRIPANN